MISLDVHKVTKVRPEIKHFPDFDVFYLHITGLDLDDKEVQVKIVLYSYGHDAQGHQTVTSGVPMDLLNALGPAIERGKNAKE